MTKHTPGPWGIYKGEENDAIAVSYWPTLPNGKGGGHVGVSIARMPVPSQFIDRAEINANARLIAAAPDLLAALQAYVEKDFEMGGTSSKAEIHNARLAAARAAINKAQGK